MPVTDEQVDAYQRDGVVLLPGLLAGHVEALRAAVEANMASPSPFERTYKPSDGTAPFFQDFCNWPRIEGYRNAVLSSPMAEVGAKLMRSRTARIFHDHVLVKEPGNSMPTPWHQDQPYYNVGGRQNVSFWIPVDPVPLASTLRFVAGSHDGTWYMPRTFRDQQAKWFPEGTLAELPPIDAEPDNYRQLAWALEPGDCVAFHMLSLHASSGTGPGVRRRVFSARYLGNDAVHAPRRWRTSPPFAGLDQRLPDGAPMDDALFPTVWP